MTTERTDDMQTPREVKIHSLAQLSSEDCVLVLEDLAGGRLLPIHTGMSEGRSLALEVAGFKPPRPMTHDLLVSAIEMTGWTVSKVVVTECASEVFLARIHLQKDGEERTLDARPSDALNVAVRASCPIYVAQTVFDSTEVIFKTIGEADVESFRKQLEKNDPSTIFAELEGRPAPKEREARRAPPDSSGEDADPDPRT
ncbi:bifunctional nuclease family protein [bacterium]|nr:bifunctional nuclease family protein [bacterium]